MTRNKYCTLWFCLCGLTGFSQSADILRVEYTFLPRNDSEIQTSRYKFLFNYPHKVAEDQYLVTGVEYSQIAFDNSGDLPFDGSELKKLHIIDFNLGYIFKWNDNWRFVNIVTPRLASNFVNGIEARDFKLNLTSSFWKEKNTGDRPFRLVLGLTYNSTTGLPFPLPLINYNRRFLPDWSYIIGIPKSAIRYHFNERHSLELAAFLDGYWVNVQNDIPLDDGGVGSSISLSAGISAMEYQYKLTDRFWLYGLAGYAFFQNGVLRDDKRNSVYVLTKEGNIYFRTGLKISIF